MAFLKDSAVLYQGIQRLKIKNKSLLPIVQGGMGVGVSAHRLAGTMAQLGGVGTISSVDLRRHHPDLMQSTAQNPSKAHINTCNPDCFGSRNQGGQNLSQRQWSHSGQYYEGGTPLMRTLCVNRVKVERTPLWWEQGYRWIYPS